MNSSNDQSNSSESFPEVPFDDLMDSVPGRVALLDSQGQIIRVNERWNDFGLENDEDPGIEWIGKDYFEISRSLLGISIETASIASEGILRVREGKQSGFELEYPRHSKGKMLWFSMSVTQLEWGKARWVSVIHTDITEKRKTENERLHNVLSMYVTFQQAAVGIAHVTTEGRFIRINTKLCEILGYSYEEMLSLNFQDITHPDDQDADLVQMNLLLEGKNDSYSLEKRYFHKMGRKVWARLTVSLVRDLSGRPLHFVSVIENIDKRKLAEEALRESEKKFRNLMEQSPVSIQIHTPDGKLHQSNAAYEKLFALSKESLAELYQKYNVLEDQQAEKLGLISYIRKVFRGEMVSFPEYEYNGIDTLKTLDVEKPVSRRCWLKTSGFPLMDHSGNMTYAIFMSEDITERKLAEIKLRQSEAFSQSILASLQDHIAVLDREGNILAVNDAWMQFSRENDAEYSGRVGPGVNYLNICREALDSSDETAAKALEGIRSVVNGSSGLFKIEYPCDSPTAKRWFLMTVSPFKEREGGVIVTHTNITSRKLADLKLKESEQNYRSLIEQAQDGIALIQDGLIMFVNSSIAEYLGYTVDELLNRPFMEFIADEQVEKVREYYIKRLNNEPVPSIYESAIRHKNGTDLEAEFNAGLTTYRGKPAVLVIVRDISERKKAEEERNRLFSMSPDLIGIAGFDGYLKQLNPAWEVLLGYTPDELMAKPFVDFMHSDDRNSTNAEIAKLATGHMTIDFENRYIHKDGSVRHISWTAAPIPEEGILYAIGRDITQRKKAEEEIISYQQRLKDLAEQLTLSEEKQNKLIATNLHDHVGQLLASSRLQLAALHDDMSKTEILSKTGQISRGLLQAIQATREVIFDLSPPQLNEIGLYAATSDWMDEEVETKHGIKARITGDDRVYNIDDNMRILLFRSIRELLMNVVKHARANRVDVNISERAKDLNITVKDDGKGFSYNPEMLRLRSSGFGLFSIQERVANYGGYMSIESSPGKGTAITLSFPLSGSVS